MTTGQKVTQTVDVIVKSRAEEADGFKVELDIPSFGSKYPTLLTRVHPTIAAHLKPNAALRVVLERQNLKKDKTGEKPYDYYWGIASIPGKVGDGRTAGAEAPTADDVEAFRESFNPDTQPGRPTAPPVAPKPAAGGNGYADPTRASIESQVCVKEAWETLRDLMRMDRVDLLTDAGRIKAAELLEAFTLMGVRAMHEAGKTLREMA